MGVRHTVWWGGSLVGGPGHPLSEKFWNWGPRKWVFRFPEAKPACHMGCLPFVRVNRLEWPLNNGKGLSKPSKPTERDSAPHLQFDFLQLFSADERLETGKCSTEMVRNFPPFRFEREKRNTSGGSQQFPNGLTGKWLFHLTYNRNFRILWLNGKHPWSLPLFLI